MDLKHSTDLLNLTSARRLLKHSRARVQIIFNKHFSISGPDVVLRSNLIIEDDRRFRSRLHSCTGTSYETITLGAIVCKRDKKRSETK